MPTIHAVSVARHATQRWQRPVHYAFAAQDAVAPLVALELPKAMLSVPVAFLAAQGDEGDAGGGFVLVAVQGLQPGQNLLVAPDGRWLGGYLPSAYRGYPFVLVAAADGRQVLCVDEDSGLLGADAAPAGEAFFVEATEASPSPTPTPSPAVAETLSFLNQIASNRLATQAICGVLHKHGLIQPWPLVVPAESGEQTIAGLFRIDEAALNQLGAEAWLELRDAGALPVVYCQLLSMQHVPKLVQLAQAHAKVAQDKAAKEKAAQEQAAQPLVSAKGDLNLEFLNKSGTLSFGNLFK